MSAARPMSALRRAMPGMPAAHPAAEPASETPPSPRVEARSVTAAPRPPRRSRGSESRPVRALEAGSRRWATANYSATRLANFRLPVDLHDHYRELVRRVEQTHPRLRRPSLTEVIIALLEEGPQTPEEVAELLRRRRTAEHSREVSR